MSYLVVGAVGAQRGVDPAVLERLERRPLRLSRTIDDGARRRAALESAAREAWGELSAGTRRMLGDAEGNLIARARRVDDPWVRYFASHDPTSDFACVGCQILLLCGGNDLHVDAARNLPPIRMALAAAGNADRTVQELPRLNHLLQQCTTGSHGEYYDIEQTMAPAALEAITQWLCERFATK